MGKIKKKNNWWMLELVPVFMMSGFWLCITRVLLYIKYSEMILVCMLISCFGLMYCMKWMYEVIRE